MSKNRDRNVLTDSLAGDLIKKKLVMWWLRLLLVLAGTGISLIGIVFLALTIAFSKKESVFHRGELYVGLVFLLGGVTLCVWGRRRASSHLKAIDAELASRSKR